MRSHAIAENLKRKALDTRALGSRTKSLTRQQGTARGPPAAQCCILAVATRARISRRRWSVMDSDLVDLYENARRDI